MARQRTAGTRSRSRSQPGRPKLDPRFALLLSLPTPTLTELKRDEDARIRKLDEEVRELVDRRGEEELKEEDVRGAFESIERRLFTPLTTGIYVPPRRQEPRVSPLRMRQPYASVFVLCDGSAQDLRRLGARVRGQAGDVFTAFVPLDRVAALEEVSWVRAIELARPLFPTLNQAISFAQINTLQSAMPPITGNGVIVGMLDSTLDIYHPDFRTAAGATRLLFLWDQALTPQGTEAGPPALPGFTPAGGTTYGVEYSQATIDAELTSFNPPAVPAYQTVRHGGAVAAHGTHTTGIAAGNGLGQAGTFTGAAPGASIIFVSNFGAPGTALFADSTFVADGFAYIFARAAQLGQPCAINMSQSDNQGPHDGSALGEQFLDSLLLTPGRAITVSAGNSNQTACHAAGTVPGSGTTNLVLNYGAGAQASDDVEIWYDGHDQFTITVTPPAGAAIGPVAPGFTASATFAGGVQVQVASTVNDPRNGDKLISIIFVVPAGQSIPQGNWTFALTGTTVVNGSFQAWVDRNNRFVSAFQPPFLQENQLTLAIPATARRPFSVGNHDKTGPPPAIAARSSCGPTRDSRIKPDLATVGTNVTAPASRNMNTNPGGPLYTIMSGTSMSAPLLAGACALLFECRGGGATWANLKQILEDAAAAPAIGVPSNQFGFGYLQVGTACAVPAPNVDVWLQDDPTDTGAEPFTGPVAWLSPDIEVLDTAENPVPNPTYDPTQRFNNIVRVTVRNRGTQTARNTEAYLYWADPATNIPYPAAWQTTGIYTGGPPAGFPNQSNVIVIAQLAAAASTQLDFAWAPPAPGSNIRGDDHFCLIVRLENEIDPSQIGVGGWSGISARNNIALRNVHVQPAAGGDAETAFYIVGSDERDSLVVMPDLVGGIVTLHLPVAALPWREARVLEELDGPRTAYGLRARDPLRDATRRVKGNQVELRTEVAGAAAAELERGVATLTLARGERMVVPHVRILDGARMPVRLRVRGAQIDGRRRFVHVAQLSGGQLMGGVTLELRRGLRRRRR